MADKISDKDLKYLNDNLDHVIVYLEATGKDDHPDILCGPLQIYRHGIFLDEVVIAPTIGQWRVGWRVGCTRDWKPILAYIKEHNDTAAYVFK